MKILSELTALKSGLFPKVLLYCNVTLKHIINNLHIFNFLLVCTMAVHNEHLILTVYSFGTGLEF
jgi:hypothetical protein